MSQLKSPLRYDLMPAELAKIIDHTLLKHGAAEPDIIKLCNEAKDYSFGTICIRPYYLSLAKEELKDSKTRLCTVISFDDEGTSIVKSEEAVKSIESGANELDLVMDYNALKKGLYPMVVDGINSVLMPAYEKGVLVKLILETAALTEKEIFWACHIARTCGADYVKTSTGKIQGATPEVVRSIRGIVGEKFGVKASGGIKTLDDALNLIDAGAPKKSMLDHFRLGTSSSVPIIEEYLENFGRTK